MRVDVKSTSASWRKDPIEHSGSPTLRNLPCPPDIVRPVDKIAPERAEHLRIFGRACRKAPVVARWIVRVSVALLAVSLSRTEPRSLGTS